MSTTEHNAKYKALADKLGWEALRALMPKTVGEVRAALAEGDEHLNKWGNGPWDEAAPDPDPSQRCVCCGQRKPVKRDRALPWKSAPTLSLAEQVCVLKYVARVDAEEDL